jgi:hypothetical protein
MDENMLMRIPSTKEARALKKNLDEFMEAYNTSFSHLKSYIFFLNMLLHLKSYIF